MIIVTGAKRSGTSLMMQILEKAGFDILGEKFPKAWSVKNSHKNKQGFYESAFVEDGIHDGNCTFDPMAVNLYAVKVFAHAVCKIDMKYITKVILMVRDWREQEESLRQLLNANGAPSDYENGHNFFYEYNEFFIDYQNRQFQAIVINYNNLLSDAETNLRNLRRFLGVGRFDLGMKQIKNRYHTVKVKKLKYERTPFNDFLDRYYNAIQTGFIPESLNDERNRWQEIVYKNIQKINDEKKPVEAGAKE